MTPPTGCLVCGQPVTYPEFTMLCNSCDAANLRYANEETPHA